MKGRFDYFVYQKGLGRWLAASRERVVGMVRSFDEIFDQLEEHLARADFLGAARILENELLSSSLSEESTQQCLHWLGVCLATHAVRLQHDQGGVAEASELFRSAESAYREALGLRPDSVGTRAALSRLLLDLRREPAEVLSVIEGVEHVDLRGKDAEEVFQIHGALMILGTTRCLLSQFASGETTYRLALGEHVRQIVNEPDLSDFSYFESYGVAVPRPLRDLVLELASRFKNVNPDAVSMIRRLSTRDSEYDGTTMLGP